MPTGYTANIGKGETFKDYAKKCLHAFVIHLRDEKLDAPLPKEFKPSDYHSKKLTELKKTRSYLWALTDKQKKSEAKKQFEKEIGDYHRRNAESLDLKNKYEAVLKEAREYIPPTDKHIAYKNFMVTQIEESIKWDCGTEYNIYPKELTGDKWYNEQLLKVEKDIKYHTDEHEQELERMAKNNEWYKAVLKSLP